MNSLLRRIPHRSTPHCISACSETLLGEIRETLSMIDYQLRAIRTNELIKIKFQIGGVKCSTYSVYNIKCSLAPAFPTSPFSLPSFPPHLSSNNILRFDLNLRTRTSFSDHFTIVSKDHSQHLFFFFFFIIDHYSASLRRLISTSILPFIIPPGRAS